MHTCDRFTLYHSVVISPFPTLVMGCQNNFFKGNKLIIQSEYRCLQYSLQDYAGMIKGNSSSSFLWTLYDKLSQQSHSNGYAVVIRLLHLVFASKNEKIFWHFIFGYETADL